MSFDRILVAVDGSPLADHALEVALELARRLHAEIGVVHVVDPGRAADAEGGLLAAEVLEDRRGEAVEILTHIRKNLSSPALASAFISEGNPADEIVAKASTWKADLIVIASHGRSGLVRVVMGSVAEQVLRHAPIPVLVVRGESAKVAAP